MVRISFVMLSFFKKWKGEFDTHNVYQLTWLRYHFKKEFVPRRYPIHRNTGVHVHDVLINKQNEEMLNHVAALPLPVELLNQIFLFSYEPPPSSIDIVYRHARKG
jgi:hypothetical protein